MSDRLGTPSDLPVLLCRGCGWAQATLDGYCLDCVPPVEDLDEGDQPSEEAEDE